MKIKRVRISTIAADTTKHDYILEVKNLLKNHDASNHNKNQFESYEKRANELLGGKEDSERKTVMMLSA
jgi:hypothetical protein